MKRTALVICSILLILVSLFGIVTAVLAVAAVLFAVFAIVNAKKKAKAPVETDEDIYEKA